MKKQILLALGLMVFARPALADVTQLRDQLLSSDETTAAAARKEAETLNSKDKKMLVMSLIMPLHQSPETAQSAALALSVLGKESEEALPELMDALHYDDPTVAQAVGAALIKIGPNAIHPLTKALEDPNFVIRQRAAMILGAFGPDAHKAAPDLVELLSDSQTEAAAEDALIKIGTPSVSALSDALRKSSPADRQIQIRLLGRFGAAANPALIQTLRKDDNSTVRVTAAAALGEIRPIDPGTVPALIDAMKDPDDNTRTAAVGALGQIGPDAKAALGVLIAASHTDPEALAKQNAGRALETVGRANKSSLPGLAANLKSDDGDTRRESAIAIGQADAAPGDVIPLLALALKDPTTEVKMSVIQIGAEMLKTQKDAVALFRIACFVNDKKVRAAAIDALGGATAAPDDAALVLDDVLHDADPMVRNQCVQSLARLGPAGVPALVHELNDSYTAVGDNAEAAILSIGPGAIPALQKAQAATTDPVLQKKIPALIAQLQKHSAK